MAMVDLLELLCVSIDITQAQ